MNSENMCGTSVEDSLDSIDSTVTSDSFAKLRRLKIQESIIAAAIEKCYSDEDATSNSNHNSDSKIYSIKVRNDIMEIKNLFEDLKIVSSDSEDNIKKINIEEIKKHILHLNDKIKFLEDFINTELTSLRSEEVEILKQMKEKLKQENSIHVKVKRLNKQYNEVVPSPVRVLINSPMKCKEVQQFQAFMSKSKNRYGGWNEYNHNIFIQIWNKFYASNDIENLENNMRKISCHKLLPQFKDEIYEKIPGIQLEDIVLHSKWYSEYCYLKRAQQAALDKWRENKRKMKGRQEKVKSKKDIVQKHNEKLCKKQNETYNQNVKQKSKFKRLLEDVGSEQNNSPFDVSKAPLDSSLDINQVFNFDEKVPNTNFTERHKPIIPKLKSSTFAMPTEQWINRCNGNGKRDAFQYVNSNIEHVDKLCIPNWRLGLHKHRILESEKPI